MKIVLKCLVVLAISISAATCFAQGLAERVHEHTLKNGMKLLMVPRHTSPTVAAWIRFKVGSVDERSDERGLAPALDDEIRGRVQRGGDDGGHPPRGHVHPHESAKAAAAEDLLRHQGRGVRHRPPAGVRGTQCLPSRSP